MATYTDNYQLTKPTYAEQADISVINSNMNIIDDIMHSSQISLAPAYNQSQTYAEGDVVMYELLMYKCISPTTGVWDASKWERTTASESGGGGSAELDILGEGSGAVVSFADGASAELAKCIAEIVPKQAGSGTPSPSNVRAISGYTAVKVNVSGKNKLPTTVSIIKSLNTGGTWTGNKYVVLGLTYEILTDDGVTVNGIKVNGTATAQALFYLYDTNNESCPFNDDILSGCPSGGNTTTYDLRVSDVTTGSSMEYGTGMTIALNDTGRWRCQIMVRNGVTMNGEVFYPMIRTATESAEYEPYKGSTTTTPLGQTVYGGQLNVLTGELTIDRVAVDMGSLEWSYNSTYQRFGAVISDMKPAEANGTPLEGLICSAYATGSANNTANSSYNGYIGVSTTSTLNARNENYTDATTFTSVVSGQTVVYPLATPQTVQLTPQEVNSLLGQNNISADTGDVDIVYVKASAPIQPNPTGTPTATLKKLGIEGAVFEVEGGGGGSSEIVIDDTERVIGTYFGKTLYQRVITPTITTNSTLAGDLKYGSVALADYINSVDMAFVDLSVSYIEPATGATRALVMASYEKDSGNIVIVTMFARTNSPSSLCIKYTKITD